VNIQVMQCPRDGNVDQSGEVTPGDALLAFQEFLEKLGYAYCEESHNPAYQLFLS